MTVICGEGLPVPAELTPATENVIEPALRIPTRQLPEVVMPEQPVVPVLFQLYEVGWLVQLALMVARVPTASGVVGPFSVQVGVAPPPLPLPHATVRFDDVPEVVKLVQF
jgi:hypothetical protein